MDSQNKITRQNIILTENGAVFEDGSDVIPKPKGKTIEKEIFLRVPSVSEPINAPRPATNRMAPP
jgi:hypothetical protein